MLSITLDKGGGGGGIGGGDANDKVEEKSSLERCELLWILPTTEGEELENLLWLISRNDCLYPTRCDELDCSKLLLESGYTRLGCISRLLSYASLIGLTTLLECEKMRRSDTTLLDPSL